MGRGQKIGGVEHGAKELKLYFYLIKEKNVGKLVLCPQNSSSEGSVALLAGSAIQRQPSAVGPL